MKPFRSSLSKRFPRPRSCVSMAEFWQTEAPIDDYSALPERLMQLAEGSGSTQ